MRLFHVEFEAAVGVHVVPDQGRDGLLVAVRSLRGKLEDSARRSETRRASVG